MSDIFTIMNSAPKADELLKAMTDETTAKRLMARNVQEPKSAIIDPINVLNYEGVRAKPTAIPYSALRKMATIPAISAIILTRLNQVARFARRPRFDGDLGFKIVTKDQDRRMGDAAKKRAFEIEEFILRTGAVRNRRRKDNFNTFLRKITRDTLTLDVMAWENVQDLKGDLSEVWAVDGATIELVADLPVSEIYQPFVYVPETPKGLQHKGEIAYVQRLNGVVTAEYTEDDLCYAVRNPRTDIEFTSFGFSELEMLIEIVTGIVNGVRYNTSYFSHSSLPQGVLELVGNYDDKHLESFRRAWTVLTSGAAGKWKVPVMALQDGQGFKFTSFKNSNRDMEFNEFLEFLFNIASAVYQIDPNEVGFKSWTSGKGMNQTDNTGKKIESSLDKGFVPLMNFLSDTINYEIVDFIDPNFSFAWVGVDEEDEEKQIDRDKTYVEMGYKTINMLRKEKDEDLIPEKWADAPANPQLLQVYMADNQMGAEYLQDENPSEGGGDKKVEKSLNKESVVISWDDY